MCARRGSSEAELVANPRLLNKGAERMAQQRARRLAQNFCAGQEEARGFGLVGKAAAKVYRIKVVTNRGEMSGVTTNDTRPLDGAEKKKIARIIAIMKCRRQ